MSRLRFNPSEILVLALILVPCLAGGVYAIFSLSGSKPNRVASSNLINPSPEPPAQTESTFADVAAVPDGVFAYGGSTTWAPVRGKLDLLIQQAYPSFQLRYTEDDVAKPGSGTGIKMLLESQLSFSQSSRALKDEEYQQAKDLGFAITQTPVAADGIAVTVNPNLSIDGLSLADLGRIYRGEVTNWQEVGGPDLAITPYTRRREDSGTVEFFVEAVMDDADFGSAVVFVDTLTIGLQQVAQDTGGIYYGSAPEIVPQCKAKPLPLINDVGDITSPYQGAYVLPSQCPAERNEINFAAFQSGAYPLTRPLYVISRDDDPAASEAAEAYAQLLLTDQGQRLIQEAGFVPIRAE
ncbi:MAG: PstS family phosphate ABC transporter substrate-binding protein [Elainellaceae cyanobacterium]